MPDPTAAYYSGLPGYVYLWFLAIVAFGLFGHRVYQLLGVLAEARPEPRWDQVPRRLRHFAANVLGQKRLFNEPAFGLAHFFIFWAFVFYAASFMWNLARGLVPALPIPYSDDVAWMALPMEVLGAIALAGLAAVAARRYIFTPQSLERTRDASLVLLLIALLLVTFLGGQGFKAMAGAHPGAGTPVGSLLAQGFAAGGITPQAAASLYLWMWWIHMLIVLGFLAYLPYSKHMHLLASPLGVFFASLQPGAMPPPSQGASRMEEFTWRQLFSAYSCAECGRCDRVCPAFNSGYALSPKKVIHDLKEVVLDSVPLIRPVRSSDPPGNASAGKVRQIVGDVVRPEEIWACTSCMACMQRCPVFNEHIPLLTEMRRYLVSQGDVESGLQEALMNVTRYGNSFGKSARARAKWTRGLDFKIKDARKEPVEYLWHVGDYASFDPRLQAVTQAAARVFRRAGLDFGILYGRERNAGTDIRRIGEEGLFELLRDKNLKALGKAQFEKIVTTDPHTYHALKHEYSQGNGCRGRNGVNVLHCTEVLDHLVQEGRLPIRNGADSAVTYHDPCYLGRYSGIFKPPRRLIRSLGARLVEMPRNRLNAYCCGAGGGRIWMEDVPGIQERPAENRVREAAAALPQEGTLVVSCPKDFVMFQDALKSTGLEGSLLVKDVIELVEAATG